MMFQAFLLGLTLGGWVGYLSEKPLPLFAAATGFLADTSAAFSDDLELDESEKEERRILEHEGVTPEALFIGPTLFVATATSSPRSVRVPTIIYHSVRPHLKGESTYQDAYDVTPELLEKHLEYLIAQHFTPVTMREVAHFLSGDGQLPEHPVLLTFDDGWKNQYEYAFPLLKKHGIHATFFVYTNPIDHKKPHWMSWDDLRELDRAGMEIGGHSHTHPILTKISDMAILEREILDSKKELETELGHGIVSFAYPFGMHDIRVEETVRKAGYLIARTTEPGVWNDPEHAFVFHGTLSSDHMHDFVNAMTRKN